ncbi:hypothetical protein [Bradyrhizobium sp. SZCCHNS3053]|uniref:hypothetical protein n=1 Tax=Bradyrhizobium sp. SZCCHNS3053 TaxID=3057322 RepID=UPI002916F353|nr:hypothetical protein [Bradyrhizobium sp. SZCCHNS3053]
MVYIADQVFRDYETDGVPASGAHKPVKSEIRGLLDQYKEPQFSGLMFYVRPDGNNANDGQTNSSGGAWRNINYALAYARDNFDLRSNIVSIVGSGTFDENVVVTGPAVGDAGAGLVLRGPSGNPDDFVISPSSGSAVLADWGGTLNLQNVRIKALGGAGVQAIRHSRLIMTNPRFDNCGDTQVYASRHGYIEIDGDYSIVGSGGATARHLEATHHGNIRWTGNAQTCTITGAQQYLYFANCESQGDITVTSNPVGVVTYTGGAVTGIRHRIVSGGMIQWVAPMGGSYAAFPGSVAPFCDADSSFSLGQTKPLALVQSFTRDISVAGSQSITGLGFKPRGLIVMGGVNGAARASWGLAGAGSGMIEWSHGITANSFVSATSQLIGMVVDASNYSIATLTSFDDDGFTISWTKTGSPTGTATLTFMAFP